MANKHTESYEAKRGALMQLLYLMKPYWMKLLVVAGFIVLANLADLIKPRIYQTIIDDFLTGTGEKTGSFFTSTLIGLGISYFLVIFVSAASALIQSRMITRICQKILHSVRMRMFKHIHLMTLSDMDDMGSGLKHSMRNRAS